MEPPEQAYGVAVINSNEDIVDLIRLLLADEGISSVSGHIVDFKRGRQDLLAFLDTYRPGVVIYDIAPPYEENWQFFQLVRQTRQGQACQFILTTTNKVALERLIGVTDVIEILGKPLDLEEIVALIKQKLEE